MGATSRVQSLHMDAWKPVHLRMMQLGGNRRFRDFLSEHGIPEDLPIRDKYATRAAKWYRENLRALAEGQEPLEPLKPGEGTQSTLETELGTQEQLALDHVFAQAPLLR